MKINTGQGTIPLITLIGIWSISALTSLPGLAVSPILGELSTIFPHATELDIQMLTSLPSLLIIPFVLLAGKLAEKRDFIRLLRVGLWLLSGKAVWIQFRHNQYDAGGGYGRNGLSGRGTLAFAFCRLSVAADFFGSFGLFKKEYGFGHGEAGVGCYSFHAVCACDFR